jgi:outer membrane protein OmpA-like peptidoglycan-associated protein
MIALLLRLGLLGGLSVVGLLGGVAVAQWFPGTVTGQPPVELGLRAIDRQLSRWWRLGSAPIAPAQSPVAVTASPTRSPIPSPAPSLTPERRKALQKQLQALEADLNALIGEAGAIEAELGSRSPTEPIEQRVQSIARSLNGTPNAAPARPTSPGVANGRLAIGLPADLLFQDNHSNLRPDAGEILDSIAADLRAYPGAVVRVAGHSDAIGDPAANRELSLRRARAVAQYLADRLEGPYRWVVAGFGASRPIASGEDPASHQRNRRIEIMIEPPVAP